MGHSVKIFLFLPPLLFALDRKSVTGYDFTNFTGRR
jgi:hypothetical protein